MNIKNTTPQDLNEIIRLYENARSLQRAKGVTLWPQFEKGLIETEIANLEQWKIIIDDQLACIWSTTFNDPQIWGDRNNEPSVYIHRIATNPTFRGRNLVVEIVDWAINYAENNNKKFIRMDTVGENNGLINYYQKCGFEYLGMSQLKDTNSLPSHYHNATVSLFQISLT